MKVCDACHKPESTDSPVIHFYFGLFREAIGTSLFHSTGSPQGVALSVPVDLCQKCFETGNLGPADERFGEALVAAANKREQDTPKAPQGPTTT